MRVGYKEPGGTLEYIDTEGTLEDFQNLVGGYVEVLYYRNVVLLCDEEGWIKGLPFNFVLEGNKLVGPVVICGIEGGNFCSVGEIPHDLMVVLENLV